MTLERLSEQSLVLKYGELKVKHISDNSIYFDNLKRDGSRAHPLKGDSGSPLVCADEDGFGWLKSGSVRKNFARYLRLEFFKTWITNKKREIQNRNQTENFRGFN